MENTNFVKLQWQNDFFLICFKLDYFCSGHKSFSYFLYFQHWKVQPCLSRSAQNMCRKFGRWWDLETLRSEMLASDEASCCHVMSTSLTCGSEERFSLCPAFCPADHWYAFFSSIVMLELMYTHFQQTNTKDSRLMASNLFSLCFSKLYLHMATHGYTCVNPVLVLFYTCSFVFFQFYTCVTPFFWVYTWLHMATHGYTSTTHLRKFPRSPIVWPEVLPLSGREGAQCQAPHTDKSFKLTIQT